MELLYMGVVCIVIIQQIIIYKLLLKLENKNVRFMGKKRK